MLLRDTIYTIHGDTCYGRLMCYDMRRQMFVRRKLSNFEIL